MSLRVPGYGTSSPTGAIRTDSYALGDTAPNMHPGTVQLTIPLKSSLEIQLPKSKIYPVGPRDREVINAAFQPLHDQGKMSYITGHTTTGFPVFII